MATQMAQQAAGTPSAAKRGVKAATVASGADLDQQSAVSGAESAQDSATEKRRRGRPPKARDAVSEFVEWWKPGWRERLR
jgi:hypothetical protein